MTSIDLPFSCLLRARHLRTEHESALTDLHLPDILLNRFKA